jgi:hypothetical protein
MDWLPSGPRKAIFGRVNSVSGALIFVISNVEFDGKGASEIHPIDIVISTDCLDDLLLERTILTM